MREYRSYGSVRGAPGNRRLYRDRTARASDRAVDHVPARVRGVALDRSGQPIGRASLPGAFMPTEISESTIAAVWNDDENPEQVRVYGLSRRVAKEK